MPLHRTPEPALSKAYIAELRIIEAWRSRLDGARWIDALKGWSASRKSESTREIYMRAIAEFGDWPEREYGNYPLPSEVTEERVAAYGKWLRERRTGRSVAIPQPALPSSIPSPSCV
jgi:hypothetical protein